MSFDKMYPIYSVGISTMTSRRRLLFSLAMTSLITGCIGMESVSLPEVKRLEIYISSVDESESKWIAELEVKNQTNLEGVKGNFHDVELVGYSENQQTVCRESVGTIQPNESKNVRISCMNSPTVITCTAKESICNKNIEIEEISRSQEDDTVWNTDTRKCEDS